MENRKENVAMDAQKRALALGGGLLTLAVIAAVVTLLFGNVTGQQAEAQADTTQRTVSVSGHGQVEVSPDTGQVTVGVDTVNEDANVALEEANEKVEAITAAIAGLGIAEDDITTAYFSIWPEYDYSSNSPKLTGFRVSYTVNVKVRDIGLTGDVVGTAVDAGANNVQNVSFTVDDTSAAIDQARELAVENARQKAEKLAEQANGALGQVVTISENTFAPGPVARDEAQEAAGDAAAPVFNPGASIVTVDVQVSWELN